MPKLLFLAILALGIALSGCGGGNSSPAPVNSPPVNQAPSANAGADQSVDEGTTVNLSGTGEDGDGTIVSYGWQQDSGTTITITNADTANASFVAPMVAASEVLVVRVTVTDDDGGTGSDTVSITVNDIATPPQNQAPTANAGADQSIDEGTTVNLSGTGEDGDGTIVSYGWQQDSGTTITITNADTANASFVAPMVAASEVLVVRVTVTDDDGATGSDTVSIAVNDLDAPPPPPPSGGNFIPLGDLSGGDFSSFASGATDVQVVDYH